MEFSCVLFVNRPNRRLVVVHNSNSSEENKKPKKKTTAQMLQNEMAQMNKQRSLKCGTHEKEQQQKNRNEWGERKMRQHT